LLCLPRFLKSVNLGCSIVSFRTICTWWIGHTFVRDKNRKHRKKCKKSKKNNQSNNCWGWEAPTLFAFIWFRSISRFANCLKTKLRKQLILKINIVLVSSPSKIFKKIWTLRMRLKDIIDQHWSKIICFVTKFTKRNGRLKCQ